jgi:branched-chain amino acid transport system substrate-binding protein
MENLIGKSLGRYHILEQLGEGGMATVFKAYDTNLEREVAVKIIRREAFPPEQSDHLLKRFEREAKALAQLVHPNIVNVIDYGSQDGNPYLVMNFLPGGTLKDKLGKPMPWPEAVKMLLPIAEALDYAHSRNIIHRDVKPSNILLTQRGQPMLTDFGIAKILEAGEVTQLTATGVGIGTPDYMAPEQWTGAVGPQTDIYSLGVVLYQMVTGRLPFIADTPAAVLIKHARDPLPSPKSIVPDLPDEVEQVLIKALAKEPENRYRDMGAFVEALGKLSREAPTVLAPAAGQAESLQGTLVKPPVPAEPGKVEATVIAPPGKMKRTWLVWFAVGMGVLVLVGAAIVLFSNMGHPAAPIQTQQPSSIPTIIPTTAVLNKPLPSTIPTVVVPTATPFTCTDSIGCVKIGPTDPIHIAYLLVVSGANSALGIDSRNGVEIAIDDAGGKILNHTIKFDGEDGLCSADGGQAAGTRLAADPTIVAVIGTSCSSEARAAEPLLSAAGFVTISSSNTATDLTDPTNPNHYPGYFRTAHNDKIQGAAAADFVYNFLGVRKAATIHDGSLYADKLQGVFADNFKQMGGTITLQTSVTIGQIDMSSVLASVASGSPELIYFPIFLPEGAFLIQQAKTTPGLENTRLMGADGLYSPDVMKTAGAVVEGFLVSSPLIQGAAYDKFVAIYVAKFGGQPINIFHAHAYDAFNIVKAAIEKVAVQDADGTLHIPRQALRDAMAATKDFQGLTGVLTCSVNGDCANPIIGVYEYHAGVYPPTLIWPTQYLK